MVQLSRYRNRLTLFLPLPWIVFSVVQKTSLHLCFLSLKWHIVLRKGSACRPCGLSPMMFWQINFLASSFGSAIHPVFSLTFGTLWWHSRSPFTDVLSRSLDVPNFPGFNVQNNPFSKPPFFCTPIRGGSSWNSFANRLVVFFWFIPAIGLFCSLEPPGWWYCQGYKSRGFHMAWEWNRIVRGSKFDKLCFAKVIID